MKWYIPSWNGDLRLVADSANPGHSLLTIESPTVAEQQKVEAIHAAMVAMGICDPRSFAWDGYLSGSILIRASVAEVGPIIAPVIRPGPATVTAVKDAEGEIHVATGEGGPAEALHAAGIDPSAVDASPTSEEATQKKRRGRPPKAKDEPVAATVKRPTPCCPRCLPGAVKPASEVLLSFLTPAEHESWAHDRTLVVAGGISGHRYLLAHRHSPAARAIGRICLDLDDREIVHFHDWTVPPEEEVLAAKLILEHREPWLRNEATLGYVGQNATDVFKNPFGDHLDGNYDARLLKALGNALGVRG